MFCATRLWRSAWGSKHEAYLLTSRRPGAQYHQKKLIQPSVKLNFHDE
jgi:hypothetical protein